MSGRRGGAAAKQVQKQTTQKEAPEPMEQVVQSEEPSRKRPWEKVDADGNKIKRKKVPGAKNIRVKNHVQPKNAMQCLNELAPGVTYDQEPEGGDEQYGFSVIVDGNTYTGYGPSKQIAKQNAAESALVSFVKAPIKKAESGEGEEENGTSKADDKTPWATLASFAMYKLFNDWKDGRIGFGTSHTPTLGGSPRNQFDLRDYLSAKDSAGVTKPQGTARPAKKVPDNASAMHPLMVLHQMRPGLDYITDMTTGEDNKPHFIVSITIEGQEFTGEGANLKKAKTNLAKDAILGLFGVESCFEIPA